MAWLCGLLGLGLLQCLSCPIVCHPMQPILKRISPLLVQFEDSSASCLLCDTSCATVQAAYKHLRSGAHKRRYSAYALECRRLGTDPEQHLTIGRVLSTVAIDTVIEDDDASTADADAAHAGDYGPNDGPLPDMPGGSLPNVDPDSLDSFSFAVMADQAAQADHEGVPIATTGLPSEDVMASVLQETGCHESDYDSEEDMRHVYHDEPVEAASSRPLVRPETYVRPIPGYILPEYALRAIAYVVKIFSPSDPIPSACVAIAMQWLCPANAVEV